MDPQTPTPPPPPRRRLTPEELAEGVNRLVETPPTPQPGFFEEAENWYANPGVQAGLIAGSLIPGGQIARAISAVEALGGAASVVNRFNQGDYVGMTAPILFTALGVHGYRRAAQDLNRANNIKALATLTGMTPTEIAEARRAQNLDPSTLNSWLRRQIARLNGELAPSAAEASSEATRLDTLLTEARATKAAKDAEAAAAAAPQPGGGPRPPKPPPVITRQPRPTPAPEAPPVAEPAPTRRAPVATGKDPEWVTNGQPILGPGGEVFYEQPDGRIFTHDGQEVAPHPAAATAPAPAAPEPPPVIRTPARTTPDEVVRAAQEAEPTGPPKPGEPGGRRLTKFEKAMRAQESPAPSVGSTPSAEDFGTIRRRVLTGQIADFERELANLDPKGNPSVRALLQDEIESLRLELGDVPPEPPKRTFKPGEPRPPVVPKPSTGETSGIPGVTPTVAAEVPKRTFKPNEPRPAVKSKPKPESAQGELPLETQTFAPGQPRPAVAATPVTAEKLPAGLSGARPRYGSGAKNFEVEFADDVDRAAYITAQAKRSKQDAQYVKFVRDKTGWSEAEVRAHGAAVRAKLKTAAQAADDETKVLKIEAVRQAGPSTFKPGARRPPAPKPPEVVPGAGGVAVEEPPAGPRVFPKERPEVATLMQQSNQLAKTRRELEAAMRGVKDPAKLAEMQADSAALRRQVLAVQEKIRALKNPPLGGDLPAAPAAVAGGEPTGPLTPAPAAAETEAEALKRYGLEPHRTVKLYRSMEPEEYAEWQRTGIIKAGAGERASTRRSVAEFFQQRRKPGSVIVEFETSTANLQQGNNAPGNYRIVRDVQTHSPGTPPVDREALYQRWREVNDKLQQMSAIPNRATVDPRLRQSLLSLEDKWRQELSSIEQQLNPDDLQVVGDQTQTHMQRIIDQARAETGLPTPEVPAAGAPPVPPTEGLAELRRRVMANLVDQREQLVAGLEQVKGGPPALVRDIKARIESLDRQIAERTAAMSTPPEPMAASEPVVPPSSVLPPEVRGTREERIQKIRDQFGGTTPPRAPEPPPAPAGPSLGLGTEPGGVPLPRPKPGEVPAAVPESAPLAPTAPDLAPAPPVTPPVMDPVQKAYDAIRSRLNFYEVQMRKYAGREGQLHPIDQRQFESLRDDIKALKTRLAKYESFPSVKELLAQEAADAAAAKARAALPEPGAPPKPYRKPRSSSTSPEEAARIDEAMAAQAEEERKRLEAGRKPYVPNQRQPRLSRPEIRAKKAAAAEAERQRLLKAALERLQQKGQAPTKPATGRIRSTGRVLRSKLKDIAPSLDTEKLGEGIDKLADDVEKAPPRKPGPRLIDKKTGKVIKQLGEKKGPEDAGFALHELMTHIVGGTSGAITGSIMGNQGPEEDRARNRVVGGAAGALMGLLGSHALTLKMKGGSLSKAAQKYQFFSLLSDVTTLGRANLGALSSVLNAAGEQMVLGNYQKAAAGLRQLVKDTGPGWLKILAARDQSLYLPPALRTLKLHGRANIGSGYKVLDLPGRVISAGDIVATRALHEMGYTLADIERMNLGGTPETKLGRGALSALGEDVHYTDVNKKGQTVRKILPGIGGEVYKAAARTVIPFARMAVALPERTLAYTPFINQIPAVRRQFSNVSNAKAAARGIMGGAGMVGGYLASKYSTPETDPWISAAGGPVSGLVQAGIGARRAMENDQQPGAFATQQIQNLVPGLSEQFSPSKVMGRVVPGISSLIARMMDPAYGRATGGSELEAARMREGRGDVGFPDWMQSVGDLAGASFKARLPGLRETLPEIYRGRDKFGRDILPERPTWLPSFTRDTAMRGNIFGYDIVAPKWAASTAHQLPPRYPMGDPISQRLRELEWQTGQPIIGVPNQPLNDPLMDEIASSLGVEVPRIHRDIKAAIERARGMAPRLYLQDINSPTYRSLPIQDQARFAREAVTRARDNINQRISRIPRASLMVPAEREKFVAALDVLTQSLSGGWR